MVNGTKIGELAAQCCVSPDTIRFYERQGLLPAPRRTASGHRVYDHDTLVRLQFIRRAQGIGLTLQDIGEILRLRDEEGPEAGPRITDRLRARAEAIDQEIAKLRVYRDLLEAGLRLCETCSSRGIPRLERLFVRGEH